MVKRQLTQLDFFAFIESKALADPTGRLDPEATIEDFRKTGYCPISDKELKSYGFAIFPSQLHTLERSTVVMLHLYYAFGVPISREFENKASEEYDLELDDEHCIVNFKQKGQAAAAVAVVVPSPSPPPPEIPATPPAPIVPNIKSSNRNLDDFLSEKCENATDILRISGLCAEYGFDPKERRYYLAFWERVCEYRSKVLSEKNLDINSKVRTSFALSGRIEKSFLNRLRRNAQVSVDRYNRITRYVANDKSLILEKNKKNKPITGGLKGFGAQKRTRSQMMSRRNSEEIEKDIDENDEWIGKSKRMKRGPKIPANRPSSSTTSSTSSNVSGNLRRRTNVDLSNIIPTLDSQVTPPIAPSEPTDTRTLRHRHSAVRYVENEEDEEGEMEVERSEDVVEEEEEDQVAENGDDTDSMDTDDGGFQDPQPPQDQEVRKENSIADVLEEELSDVRMNEEQEKGKEDQQEEENDAQEGPSTGVRRSRREFRKRENSIFIYTKLQKQSRGTVKAAVPRNAVRKAHRAPNRPALRLSSIRSNLPTPEEEGFEATLRFIQAQIELHNRDAPMMVEEEDVAQDDLAQDSDAPDAQELVQTQNWVNQTHNDASFEVEEYVAPDSAQYVQEEEPSMISVTLEKLIKAEADAQSQISQISEDAELMEHGLLEHGLLEHELLEQQEADATKTSGLIRKYSETSQWSVLDIMTTMSQVSYDVEEEEKEPQEEPQENPREEPQEAPQLVNQKDYPPKSTEQELVAPQAPERRRVPPSFRSFSERTARSIDTLIMAPPIFPSATPPTIQQENASSSQMELAEEEIILLATVKRESVEENVEEDVGVFKVPALPGVVSLETHKNLLCSIKELIRTLELPIPRKIHRRIESTIENIKQHDTRAGIVTSGEIHEAAFSCLLNVSDSARPLASFADSEESRSLRDFLLLLKHAIHTMESPKFDKFLDLLKGSIKESLDKAIPLDKVQLALEKIISIVAP